jgi:hypothetical protein
MSKLEKVTETTEVVVGKFYRVLCAALYLSHWKDEEQDEFIEYIPIIGIAHEDKQFSDVEKHYHIDCRFVKKRKHSIGEQEKCTSEIVLVERRAEQHYAKYLVFKRRKCVNKHTRLFIPNFESSTVTVFRAWQDSMVGKSCKGRRCPHLATLMQEINGVLVCPLHDLIGCKDTEVIIKQNEQGGQRV